MIEIDGRQGEGGGQILRTSLTLSLVTGKPFRVANIRGKRRKPGLMRQHLTCVLAAAEVSKAKTKGAELRSQNLVFRPGEVAAGDYRFEVGTAGSAGLVLQTILPALWTIDQTSNVAVCGGTHNPMAPCYDFLEHSYAPVIAMLGPKIDLAIGTYGFYPAGGGEIRASVTGGESDARLELLDGTERVGQRVVALVANLPEHIAEREASAVIEDLAWHSEDAVIRSVDSPGPGNSVWAYIEFADGRREVFAAHGSKGVRAEKVASDLADEVKEFLALQVPVGPHLADQLLLPLAMSNRGGVFRTGPPTQHTLTQIESIRRFLPDVDIGCERLPESRGLGNLSGAVMSARIPTVDPYSLLDEYDGLLIDAYGVLVHSSGAVPGAARFVAAIHERKFPYRIITNDASRLEETTASSYAARGISLSPEVIITAGSLVSAHIEEADLQGARILVLGPADSHEYVRRAGAEPLSPDGKSLIDGIVIADEAFEPFLKGLDRALTQAMHSYDVGRELHLICPNPDALYPASVNSFGFAAGSFAALFEHAIESRLGEPRRFERLGKPFAPMYRRAISELGEGRYAVMGDQLPTDIKGARDFGLDAFLSLQGVATREHAESSEIKPNAILSDF